LLNPASRKTGSANLATYQAIIHAKPRTGYNSVTQISAKAVPRWRRSFVKQFARTMPPNLKPYCRFPAESRGNYNMLIAIHLPVFVGVVLQKKR
jgi:hypothetical protein